MLHVWSRSSPSSEPRSARRAAGVDARRLLRALAQPSPPSSPPPPANRSPSPRSSRRACSPMASWPGSPPTCTSRPTSSGCGLYSGRGYSATGRHSRAIGCASSLGLARASGELLLPHEDLHERIRFVVGALTERGQPFVDWLLGPAAHARLRTAGFLPPREPKDAEGEQR
jgi:hypothetical protein